MDLGFASAQTTRECNSILKQLGCVYGYLKKCPLDRLLSLHVASCVGDIATLCERHGVSNWKVRLRVTQMDHVLHSLSLVLV